MCPSVSFPLLLLFSWDFSFNRLLPLLPEVKSSGTMNHLKTHPNSKFNFQQPLQASRLLGSENSRRLRLFPGSLRAHLPCKISEALFLVVSMAFPQILMDFRSISINFSHLQSLSATFSHFRSISFPFTYFLKYLTPSKTQEFIDNQKVGKATLNSRVPEDNSYTAENFGHCEKQQTFGSALPLSP